MGILRCKHQTSFLLMLTAGLATVLLSCYTLEAASFFPNSLPMRRNVGRQQLPPSALILKGGTDEEELVPEQQVDLEGTSEDAAAVAPPPISQGRPPGWFRRRFPGLPYHKLPDFLTLTRCAAIPLLCLTFYTPGKHVESGLLFASASLTDWLDGFLARRWNVSTSFGAFLDPVADKLMVSTALILLAGRHGAIVALPTCVILARELAVSALREWMAQRGQRDAVQVGFQGKVKTALTMVSLTLMLLVPEIVGDSWLSNLFLPSLAALYLCTVLTVTSGAVYFQAAAPFLFENS